VLVAVAVVAVLIAVTHQVLREQAVRAKLIRTLLVAVALLDLQPAVLSVPLAALAVLSDLEPAAAVVAPAVITQAVQLVMEGNLAVVAVVVALDLHLLEPVVQVGPVKFG
jgi:hypothetical protein